MFEDSFFERVGWKLVRRSDADGVINFDSERRVWVDQSGLLTVSLFQSELVDNYRLRFADHLIIDVLPNERLVVEHRAKSPVGTAARDHFIADQVFPRLLSHDGRLVLHAGAVRHIESSLLIVGESGAGKSSLVASFIQVDHDLLGDDALVISWPNGAACAEAVYPSLRLFSDSIDALFRRAVRTTNLAPYTSKRRLCVTEASTLATGPLPIKAIFSIAPVSRTGEIRCRRLTAAEACMVFIENSFALDPTDTPHASRRLHDASALAGEVPTFEISYPRDYARLPEVREVMLRSCLGKESAKTEV